MAEDKKLHNYHEIAQQLCRICTNGQTGTFSIATSNNHHARISLKNGAIIGANFRPYKGREALEKISQINSGRCSFLPRTLRTKEFDESMPLPDEIFKLLKIDKVEKQPGKSEPERASAPESADLKIEVVKDILQAETTKYLGPIGTVICQDHFNKAEKIGNKEELRQVIEKIAGQISDASGDSDKGAQFKTDVLSRI